MTTLTLDLKPEVYNSIRSAANKVGKKMEDLVAESLADLYPEQTPSERERALAVLQKAGLLAELSPEMKARAAKSTKTLEEVRADLGRGSGKTLSEIVIEQRGPKT